MRRTIVLAATLSVAALAALAETPDPSGQFAAPITHSKTRSEVAAELREAQRTGDILAPGDQGITLYELNPSAYPARVQLAGKTRGQVRAETLQAIHDGDIIRGELGLPERDLFPQRFMARKTHADRTATGLRDILPAAR